MQKLILSQIRPGQAFKANFLGRNLVKFRLNFNPGWQKGLLLLLLCLLPLFGLQAQTASTANYTFSTATTGSLALDKNGNAVDMSTGTTQLVAASQDQTVSAVTNIGFPFYLMGVSYTQFSVSANGMIGLGGTAVGGSVYNVGANSNPLIAAFSGDLRTGTSGKVHYKIIGTSPDRVLVVEFKNMSIVYSGTSNDGTYQARLYENTSVIEFVYGSMFRNSSASSTNPTIGFSVNTTANNMFSVNTSTQTASTASPSTKNVYTTNAVITALNSTTDGSRRVYTFTPPAAPNAPSGITFPSIGATSMTLNWTDNSSNELGFAIYRSPDGINFTQVGTTAAGTTSYFATGLSLGTLYYWKVAAFNEGQINFSAVAQATTTTTSSTYTWTGATDNTWGDPTNWTDGSGGGRNNPDPTDIIKFDGVIVTVTGVPTQTIGQLILTNNASVALQNAVASTLTIGGATGTDLDIPSGCTFKLDNQPAATGALTLVFTSGQSSTANIDGTLVLSGDGITVRNAFTATNATVTVTGTIESAGTINSTAANLIFNGTYYHDFTTVAGTIPTATWNNGSIVTIRGYTTCKTQVTGLGQTFSNFTWDCPNQTGSAGSPFLNATNMVVNGTFTLKNTGDGQTTPGTFKLSNTSAATLTVGKYIQTGGSLELSGGSTAGTLKVSGDFTQTAGKIMLWSGSTSTASTIEFNGTTNQVVNVTDLSTTKVIHYKVLNNAGITLTGTIPVNNGATMTIGSTAANPIFGGTVTYGTTNTTLAYISNAGPQFATAVEFPVTNGPTNLTINNTFTYPNNIVTLTGGDRTISGKLVLTSGFVKMGANNLTVGTITSADYSGTYDGTGAALNGRFVIQDGLGRLKRIVPTTTPADIYFPIGFNDGTTVEYLGCSFNFTANNLQRTITAGVYAGAHPDYDLAGTQPQTDYLKRYWRFSDDQAGNGAYTYSAAFRTYNDTNINGINDYVGTLSNLHVNRWDRTGLTWSEVAGTFDPTPPVIPLLRINTGNTMISCPIGGSDFTGRVNPLTSYTWNGGTSSDWFTPTNWTPNGTPTGSDSVVINNASATNQPLISSSGGTVTIKSLTLTNGSLALGPNAGITVIDTFAYAAPATTNFDCSSTFTYAGNDVQTIREVAYGNLASSGTGARVLANGAIRICGTFTPGTNAYTPNSGNTVEFNGTGNQTIPAFSYINLTSSSTGARTISGTVKIAGIFTPGTNAYTVTGSTIEFNGSNPQTIPVFTYNNLASSGGDRTIAGTIKIAGTFITDTKPYTVIGSTIEFNGTGTQSIPVLTPATGSSNYNNILVSGSGACSFGGTMTIGGSFTQRAGTVNVTNAAVNNTINFLEDLNISGGTFRLISVFNATGATVNVGTTSSVKDLNITGTGSINLESTSSSSGVAKLIVSGNIISNTTATNAVDFGTGTITDNEVQLAGDLTMNGTGKFHMTSTTARPKGLIFNGGGTQILTCNVPYSKAHLTVNNGSTVKLGANLSIAGAVVSTKTWLTVSGILDMAGFTVKANDANSAVVTGATGLIKTNGTGIYPSIEGFSLHTFNEGSTVDLGESQITTTGSITINGTVKTANPNGFSGASNTAVANGTVILGAAGAGSTIEYNGTGAQTITARDYQNLKISEVRSGAITLQPGIIGITKMFDLIATPTTWTTTGNTVDFNGSGAQTIPTFSYNSLTSSSNGARTIAGTVQIADVFTPGTNAYTVTGSTVDFNGSGAQTIPAFAYNNLTSSNTGARTISGLVQIADTFTPGTNTYAVTGSTVEFNGTAAQNIPAFSYNNLTSTSTGARTISGTVQIADTFTPGTNAYTVTGSTVEFNGSVAQTIPAFSYNNLTSSSTGARTISGTVQIAGAFTPGINAYTVTGSTVDFNGTGNQTIPAFDYDNLTSSSTGTRTISGIVRINNAFTPGTNNYSVTGSTVEFNGTTAQTIPALPVVSGSNYNNLIVSNPNPVTLSANIALSGTATVNSGSTLDLGANKISGTGNVTINGTLKTAKTEGFSGTANTALANTLTGITLGAGSTIEYNGTGAQTITARPDYQNLIISGARGGAAITLSPGTIQIAQAFNPTASGAIWTTTNNTVEFTGTTQYVPAFAFNSLKVSGSDTKTLLGNINVAGTLTMNGGQLQTNANKVILGTNALLVETDATYVTGTVETTANMIASNMFTLNGIGLSLDVKNSQNLPGATTVRRVTGTPISTSNGNHGIARYFEIVPTNNSNLKVEMAFSYHPHELNGILESNLELFKAATTNGSWVAQGFKTQNAATNTVTLNNISDFSTWTLGDQSAPLPVEMVAFSAKKVGTNVEVTWATASEKNSQGFEVQVSANGSEYHKLGFVESRNGSNFQQYRFTDLENGKTGVRYYRLKQIDLDGTVTFYGPKTVRFEAEKLQISAYPNPFDQEINLKISAVETGIITLKLSDLTGKTILNREMDIQKGNNKLNLGISEHLPVGVYLLQAQIGAEQITTRLIKK